MFSAKVQDLNDMKLVTSKQVKAAKAAMMQRNILPIFSGNIDCYLINQLCEFDLLAQVKNVMAQEETSKVHLSPIHDYFRHMLRLADTQFADPAR